MQRATVLKETLDTLQPPPENVSFCISRFSMISFSRVFQIEILIRSDDPCDNVKEVDQPAIIRLQVFACAIGLTRISSSEFFQHDTKPCDFFAAFQSCVSILEGTTSAVTKDEGKGPSKSREDSQCISG